MIKSENTEKHKKLRQMFNKETGIYAIKDNESYMNWLENMLVKNCSIPDVVHCNHENYTPFYGSEGEFMFKRCDDCGEEFD